MLPNLINLYMDTECSWG